MIGLVVGLVVFLGVHSIRVVAPGWRDRMIDRHGVMAWRVVYSVGSAIGLVLLIWGFGRTRLAPVPLWNPPAWAPGLAALLVLLASVLNAAFGVPDNRIREIVRHPMLASVVLWSAAHLIANGRLGDLVLFGSFLCWGVLDFWFCLERERLAGFVASRDGTLRADLICVLAGVVTWGVFVLFLHRWLFGVSPLHLG